MNKMFTPWRGVLVALTLIFGMSSSGFAQCDPGEIAYEITLASGGSFVSERSWEIVPAAGGPAIVSVECGDYVGETVEFCLVPGEQYTFNAYDDFGDGWNLTGVDTVWSIGWVGGPVAFAGGNPDGCTDGDFTTDCVGQCLEFSLTFSASDPPNCIPPEVSFENVRDCDTQSFSTTVTIDVPSDVGGLIVFTASVDGQQEDGGTIPNLAGQTIELGPFDLDVDVIVETNVLGATCPSVTTLSEPSLGCPIPLTCGEGLLESYCYGNNDVTPFFYQSPNAEPVVIFFQEGLIESCCDDIFIYDGEDETGDLLFSGNNGGDLTGVSATANSGSLYMVLDTDFSVSCVSGSSSASEWNWIVGCGEFDIPGCTNPDALNFSPEATVDDGSCILPDPNDEPCGAVPLECNGAPLTGTFDASSLSTDLVPLSGCGSTFSPPQGDLWFSFEADGNSTYLIDADQGGDMVVALFSGDDCGNLTLVEACSDFPEFFSDQYPAGTYYFMVRPWSAFTNTYQVSLTCVDGVPDNDEPCGAIPLVCNEPGLAGSFLGATETIADECAGTGTGDVWYSFEADGETAYSIEETSLSNVVIALYTADECSGTLTEVEECSDFPEDFSAVYPAGTYYVRLRAQSTALTFTIELNCATPPANDLPCNAIPITCTSGNVLGTTLGATEDEECGGATGGAGVWYVFTADIDGTLQLNTCQNNTPNTDYDSDISVFTGTCDDLTCLAYNDGPGTCGFHSDITFDIFQGTTYYIQVHGWTGEGNFDMEVTCTEITLDCPGLGNIGDPCDDGDPGTVFDEITPNCVCEGTPPPPGQVCGIPIDVTALPYEDSGNTADFLDDYESADLPPLAPDAIVTGTGSGLYLGGDDVVYAYTPSEDQFIDITVTNQGTWVGLYAFTGCPFDLTVGAHTAFNDPNREIEALPVTAGETYYIVISTWPAPQSTDYQLNINIAGFDCPDLNADFGDPCDDGDPLTTDDVITSECECEGTPVIPGQICESTIEVTALPYLTTDNTANYFDDYESADLPPLAPDAILTGTGSGLYLGGDDVVYEYTPAEDQFIDVNLNNHGTWVGLFVIEGCPFASTIGAHTGSDNLGREIENLPVTAGTTYYVVVSTFPAPQSTAYDLSINIAGFDCPDLEADFGDPCDDGDDDTINDTVTQDCECVGTPAPTSQCGDLTSNPNLFFGQGAPIITDEIEVSGSNGILTDLNVVVVIDHVWTSDVDVRLISPAGTEVELFTDQCGAGDNINVLLDDDGPALTCATGQVPVLFGTFAPEGSLADFNGEAFDGTWTIEVEDDVPGIDDGTLVSWCLLYELETGGPNECEDATAVMAMPEFAESEIEVSMDGAVPSGTPQCINADNPQADMWFSFESVTTNMYVRAWGLNDFDAAVEVYDACGGNLLNCQNDEPAGEREIVIIPNTTVGETYYFRVYHAGDDAPVEQDYTVAAAHIPFTQLSEDDCGVFDYTPADMITSDLPQNQFLLENWYFEFTELEEPFNTYEVLSPNGANPNFMLEWFTEAEYGRTYSVRTRARMYQGPQWGDYGEACEIGFSATPLTTTLIDEQALGFFNMCDILEAYDVPGAEAYRWKFFDGFEQIIYDSPTRFCELDLVPGLNLGSPYAVSIRAYTQGTLAPIGGWRLIAMNNFVPTTQIDENITECGESYPLNTVISAVNICAAEFYTFKFTNISDPNQEDLFYTRDDGLRSISLDWVIGLNPGDTYAVQVLGGSGGLVGEYGPSCNITIEAATPGQSGIVAGPAGTELSDVQIDLYPNPTTGEEIMLNLSNLGDVQQEVRIEVFDLYGKKVHSELLGNNGSQMISVLKLEHLASGIYNVNVVVNDENVGTEKLVIQ